VAYEGASVGEFENTTSKQKICKLSKMFSYEFLETFNIIAPQSHFLKFTFRAMFQIFSCLVVIQCSDVQKAIHFNLGLSNTQGMKFAAVMV